jgi:hypothetical protein
MSNYDPMSVRFDAMSHASSSDDDENVDDDAASEWREITAMIHQVHPGIHHLVDDATDHPDRDARLLPPDVDRMSLVPEGTEEEEADEGAEVDRGRGGIDRSKLFRRDSSSTMEPEDESIIADAENAREWSTRLFVDAYDELRHNCIAYIREIFQDEFSFFERTMSILELPFVALRTVSFRIMCFLL